MTGLVSSSRTLPVRRNIWRVEIDPEVERMVVEALDRYALIDRREVTDAMRDLYCEEISRKKFTRRQVEKGLKKYLQQGKKWPWPADLIELMEDAI